MKRLHPPHLENTNMLMSDNQHNDEYKEPLNKRQRFNETTNERFPRANLGSISNIMVNRNTNACVIPKLTTRNLRKNENILNPNINPLINIHKTPRVHYIIESLRFYSKIDKFCIGKETRTLKKIYITSQSSTAGLCSKHLDYAIQTKNKNYQLPSLTYCVMNYQCDCSVNCANSMDINNAINAKFTINSQKESHISNSNFPSTLISIQVNDEIIGYFFIKKAAPSNVKRIAQPTTFPQFRMSLSQQIKLKTSKFSKFEIIINSIANSEEYGIGVGYYFTGRNDTQLDLICCFTNINDTQFTICTDAITARQIRSIQCTMHSEQSVNPITLFTYTQRNRNTVVNNNNTNINNNMSIPISLQAAQLPPIIYYPSIPRPIQSISNSYINQPINSNNYLLYLNGNNNCNSQPTTVFNVIFSNNNNNIFNT